MKRGEDDDGLRQRRENQRYYRAHKGDQQISRNSTGLRQQRRQLRQHDQRNQLEGRNQTEKGWQVARQDAPRAYDDVAHVEFERLTVIENRKRAAHESPAP